MCSQLFILRISTDIPCFVAVKKRDLVRVLCHSSLCLVNGIELVCFDMSISRYKILCASKRLRCWSRADAAGMPRPVPLHSLFSNGKHYVSYLGF